MPSDAVAVTDTEKLRRRVYLQVDETPVRYLDPDVQGKSELGYLWV